MKRHGSMSLAAVLLGITGVARAADEIQVTVTNSGTPTTTFHNAGADIGITVSSATTLINIFAVDDVSDIGVVTINGSGSSDLKVFFGSGAFPTGGGSMTAKSGDLGGLAVSNSTQRAATSLAGHIKEDVEGSVIVGKLYRFDVDGAIKNTFEAALPGGVALFIVNAASTTSGASILCTGGDIEEVNVTGNCAGAIAATAEGGDINNVVVGGNLTATVRASAGAIGDILVDGALNVPASGGLSGIRSMDGTNRIIGATMTSATDIGLVAGDGPGVLGLLSIGSGGIPDGCVINCKTLTSPVGGGPAGILITGDLAGDIRIHDGGDVAEMIWISGSLTSTGSIDYDDTAGLMNQVIINGADGAGTWSGSVIVGSTTINSGASQPNQAPYYNATSSTLGGGAVGLARFHLHDTDCDPVNGGTISGGFNAPGQVELRFYGPIRQTPSTTYPVQIRYYDGSWHTIPGDDFSYSISGRSLTITALSSLDFDSEVTYEITPTNLQCVGVTNNPSVASFTYTIVAE
ncbi:MAG: hypothetical protein ACKVW3_07165 [Phycisphaerales bacterium]